MPTIPERPGATVHRRIDAPPSAVMATLLRAESFPVWVVGPGRVVRIDDDWPGVGAGFTHETGLAPFNLRDRTVVEHVDREGGHLRLRAAFRPLGEAHIQMHVAAVEGGSRVTMHERPTGGPGAALPHEVYGPLLRRRNQLALWRLSRVVRDHRA